MMAWKLVLLIVRYHIFGSSLCSSDTRSGTNFKPYGKGWPLVNPSYRSVKVQRTPDQPEDVSDTP